MSEPSPLETTKVIARTVGDGDGREAAGAGDNAAGRPPTGTDAAGSTAVKNSPLAADKDVVEGGDGLDQKLRSTSFWIRYLEAESLVETETEGSSAKMAAPNSGVASHPASENWLLLATFAGFMGLLVVGTVDWIFGLAERVPLLGMVAAGAAILAAVGGGGWVAREALALRKLREAEAVRKDWARADGEVLRGLIRTLGHHLREEAAAERAAADVEGAGPAAARRRAAKEMLGRRDADVVKLVSSAARQSFFIVAASPTTLIELIFLFVRVARLLREIAVVYGYRPGVLALRAFALSAARDAGAVAAASMLGEAVAGRAVGALGKALGGGVVAAWRVSRLGLMALVAIRPIPLEAHEHAELSRAIGDAVVSLNTTEEGDNSTVT